MVVAYIIKLYQFVTSSGLMPIIEFAMIGIIVMSTYLAMHAAFSQAKQSSKFVLSTMVGLTGYTVGKLVIFAWVINPVLAQSVTKNPFLN
jgi:hypothetical protein